MAATRTDVPMGNTMAGPHRLPLAALLGTAILAAPARPDGFPDYRPVAGWPKLPAVVELGAVSAVAADAGDHVTVFHRGPTPVLVFDRDGNYVRGWGHESIKTPHG